MVGRPSRLRALAELGANAESSAEALDRIARTACRVLDVPVVLVNLVGADRQRFVGCAGPEPWASMREMPLTAGFCPFALGADETYSFVDARVDPALAANPAVEQFGVVAYAGVPLRAADGEPIGTLCAIDYEARTWSQDDLGLLADLAAGVTAELRAPHRGARATTPHGAASAPRSSRTGASSARISRAATRPRRGATTPPMRSCAKSR